jgi:hypothetical protein
MIGGAGALAIERGRPPIRRSRATKSGNGATYVERQCSGVMVGTSHKDRRKGNTRRRS